MLEVIIKKKGGLLCLKYGIALLAVVFSINQKQYLEKYEHQTNKFGEYEDLLNGSNLDEWYLPLFIEEIRLSGCFNPNLFKEHNNRKAHIAKTKSTQYIPKCPVCQSPKIEKISTADRIVHGATFGLYSKTARSQWRCNNCGNLW